MSSVASPPRPYVRAYLAVYLRTFAALGVLTAAEIGAVFVPGIARPLLVAALVLLALAKAGLVLLVFMHLGREARALRGGPGAGVLALVGGMIAVPYLVVVVAIRVVRRLDR